MVEQATGRGSAPRGQPAETRRRRVFLAGYGLACVGNGALLPLIAIYLGQLRPGASPTHAVVYFALSAAMGIALSVARARNPRPGPHAACASGAAIGGAGYLVLVLPGDSALVLSAVATGAGAALFYSALPSVLVQLNGGVASTSLFSWRALVANVGVGVGALLTGATAELDPADAHRAMLFNGGANLALAALLLADGIRWRPEYPGEQAETRAVGRRLLRDRATWRLVLFHTVIVTFAFAIFEVVMPQLLVSGLGLELLLASAVLAINTVLVVVFQVPVGRLVGQLDPSRGLRLCALLVAASYLCLLVGIWSGRGMLIVLVVAFAVVFTGGECLFSAALQPALLSAAGPAGFERANGLISASFNGALLIGPSLGVALVAHTSATVTVAVWFVGAMAAAVAVPPPFLRRAAGAEP